MRSTSLWHNPEYFTSHTDSVTQTLKQSLKKARQTEIDRSGDGETERDKTQRKRY